MLVGPPQAPPSRPRRAVARRLTARAHAHAPGSPGGRCGGASRPASAGVGLGALGIGAAGQAPCGEGVGPVVGSALPRPATTPTTGPARGIPRDLPVPDPGLRLLPRRHRARRPAVDVGSWRSAVDGSVDHPGLRGARLDGARREGHHPQLREQRGGWPLRLLRPWLGVPARDLLQHAGVPRRVSTRSSARRRTA